MAIASFYRCLPLQKQINASYYSGRMMQLSGQPLALHQIAAIADGSVRLQIAPAAINQMEASRAVVRSAAAGHLPVYGINTGFGKLCEVRIPDDELAQLQLNLVRSHACGLGAPLSEP